MADHFASSVVSTRRHLVALVEAKFTTRGTRAEIISGRNAKWKFPEFPNFQKKGQPREDDQNFRNEFPETFCSISNTILNRNFRNFGRMELAPDLSSSITGSVELDNKPFEKKYLPLILLY